MQRAVWKKRLEFLFGVQRDGFAHRLRGLFQVDLMICRKYCHYMLLSGGYHDNFGMVPAFHMLGLGDPLRGNGFRVMQDLVAGFAFVQTVDESTGYFHHCSPMPSYHFVERSLLARATL